MKKTFSKIVACLFVIGVLFVSTPFFINTNAASDNYIYFGSYENTSITSNSGIDYNFQINVYKDYDNNVIKVIFRILTLDSYIGDYSDYYVSVYESITSDSYADNLLQTTSYTTMRYFYNYVDLVDGLEMSFTFDCSLNQRYFGKFVYNNYENDNDIEFQVQLDFGYSPAMYYNAIDSYEVLSYQQGQTDTITNTDPTTIISRFGQGVNSILSIPIFGQLTLGTLIFIPLSMAVLLLLLKIWRRN